VNNAEYEHGDKRVMPAVAATDMTARRKAADSDNTGVEVTNHSIAASGK
jgi:hypothetical protein